MNLEMENMKSLFILRAVMPAGEFIIILLYNNHQITGVDMHKEDLESSELVRYQAVKQEQVKMGNF